MRFVRQNNPLTKGSSSQAKCFAIWTIWTDSHCNAQKPCLQQATYAFISKYVRAFISDIQLHDSRLLISWDALCTVHFRQEHPNGVKIPPLLVRVVPTQPRCSRKVTLSFIHSNSVLKSERRHMITYVMDRTASLPGCAPTFLTEHRTTCPQLH